MEQISRYISRTSRLARQYRHKRLEPYGLNGIHHTYILNICRNPGISQEQLASLIFVNKSNVARQLAILEENGYVRRHPGEKDRREMLVFPTEKAEAIVDVVLGVLQDWNSSILEDFLPEQREMLSLAMEKIMNRAREVVDSLDSSAKEGN